MAGDRQGVRIVAIVLGLLAIALLERQWGETAPLWQLYLLPIVLAGITLKVTGGILVGLAASLLLSFLSPAAKAWGWQTLLGWQIGSIFLGGIVGYLKHQAEVQREAAEQLRRQQELRETLTDFLVHDLRSPLTNVISGLETLKLTVQDQLSPDDAELLELSLIGAHRLLTMVNSLLDLRKMEEGKFPLYLKEFSPEDAINEAVRQVQLWAKQNGVTIRTDIAPDLPSLVADRWVLIRVLVNLLSNALKYTPSGKTITVSAKVTDEGVHFAVTDEGPGIPKEYLSRIFDRFVQVEARKAGAPVGTGLGLTFCKLAVEAHGGRIWLESEVGKGTTVHFLLPLTASAAALAPQSPALTKR
ncbi:MAG: HAMP domain-containing sensor histidine kinase [Armatimonadota bacterium]|nr:HAMP domain-containing sensor histidine kinase [Armatimonadota bacterium]